MHHLSESIFTLLNLVRTGDREGLSWKMATMWVIVVVVFLTAFLVKYLVFVATVPC
jgi:hypothetical protein